MRSFALALALLLAPTLAQAETCTFPAGATAWTAVTQAIDGTCTEDSSDDFVVPNGATVTIAAGQTVTGASGSSVTVQTGGVLNVLGTMTMGDLKETGGTISVTATAGATGGIVNLVNCGSASILDAAFPCGGKTGTINLQGAVMHDSVTGGAIWQDFEADYTNRDTMKLRFSAALSGGTPAAGDLLWILSGVDKGAVYEVSAVGAFSSCPSNCTVTVRLYDADMEYGNATATYSEWDNASTRVIYADNASLTAEQAKLPDPAATTFATYQNDRMIALCHDVGANNWLTSNTCGADSTVIGESGAFAGWYAGFKNASSFSTFSASDLGNERYLIVNSLNDVNGQTYLGASFPTTPLVDILVLAESTSPERWVNPYSGGHQAIRTVIWPGFWNTDDWRIVRPAKLTYTGTASNAGFLLGGATDVDYAFFEDFFMVSVENSSGLNTSNPANFLKVIPWQDGSTSAINYNAEDFGGNCENIAFQIRDFATPATFDHLAVVDSRSDLDVSDTCCVVTDRGGAACGEGSAGFLTANQASFGGPANGVADPTSSTHGIRIEDSTNLTLTNVYGRYLGDDLLLLNNSDITAASTITVDGLSAWWMRQGSSGNVLDAAGDATYPTTFTIKDFRVANFAAGQSTACASQGGGITADANLITVHLKDGIYLDTMAQQSIGAGSTDGDFETIISNVYAYGRDQESTDTACYIGDIGASIQNSYIDGWSALSGSASIPLVERTYWRAAGAAAAAALHQSPSNFATRIENNIFTNLSAQAFLGGHSATNAVTIRNNVMRWAAASNAWAFGTLTAGNAAPTIEFNAVEGRPLLNCGSSDVSGASIDENWVVGPFSGTNGLITNYTRCPGIGETRYTSPISGLPFGALGLSGAAKVGPRGPVGVVSDLSRFGLRQRPLLHIGPRVFSVGP